MGCTNHQDIASKVYYSLPQSVQQKLDLNEMKQGSIAPDVVFKDYNPNHQYTASAKQAQIWINKAKAAYKNKDYKYGSYCFEVVSHYITDTFSAPHAVAGETLAQHVAYENQAIKMKPSRYINGSLSSLLKYGYLQGRQYWSLWLKTKSTSIPQRDLNNTGSAAYSIIRNCF